MRAARKMLKYFLRARSAERGVRSASGETRGVRLLLIARRLALRAPRSALRAPRWERFAETPVQSSDPTAGPARSCQRRYGDPAGRPAPRERAYDPLSD